MCVCVLYVYVCVCWPAGGREECVCMSVLCVYECVVCVCVLYVYVCCVCMCVLCVSVCMCVCFSNFNDRIDCNMITVNLINLCN